MLHAWVGMTEMSPLGTVSTFIQAHEPCRTSKPRSRRSRGHTLAPKENTVDGEGREPPRRGSSDRCARQDHQQLFQGRGGDPLKDGWFPTGDVVPPSIPTATCRSPTVPDVIKTGGEWISSIDLENTAVAHPAVAEAAVIGCCPSSGTSGPAPDRGEEGGERQRASRNLTSSSTRSPSGGRRRRRVYRHAAAHRHRQAAEDQVARGLPRLHAAGMTSAQADCPMSLRRELPRDSPTKHAIRVMDIRTQSGKA
ncbi:MAG: hypothetical protein M5R42_09560 [Rhodocyclaceae bacterium]|nr:hypothetical protein [Rhodocyclaceae bacterium]